MNTFLNRYLFMFGGASSVIKSINMRLCLNDLYKFDALDKKWTKMVENMYTPYPRMSHASCIYGPCLIIHGGYNTEKRRTYSDFSIFDVI